VERTVDARILPRDVVDGLLSVEAPDRFLNFVAEDFQFLREFSFRINRHRNLI